MDRIILIYNQLLLLEGDRLLHDDLIIAEGHQVSTIILLPTFWFNLYSLNLVVLHPFE